MNKDLFGVIRSFMHPFEIEIAFGTPSAAAGIWAAHQNWAYGVEAVLQKICDYEMIDIAASPDEGMALMLYRNRHLWHSDYYMCAIIATLTAHDYNVDSCGLSLQVALVIYS